MNAYYILSTVLSTFCVSTRLILATIPNVVTFRATFQMGKKTKWEFQKQNMSLPDSTAQILNYYTMKVKLNSAYERSYVSDKALEYFPNDLKKNFHKLVTG